MDQPRLTISNGRETEFEFDVTIEGAASSTASVRFVIEGVEGYDVTVNCRQRAADKWVARIPALELRESTQNFRVEVIAGDYFFCPTSGLVQVEANPRVSMAQTFQKVSEERPMVRASVPPRKSQGDSADAVPMRDEPTRRLAVLEGMSPASQREVLRQAAGAGRIFARAGEILQAGAAGAHCPSAASLAAIVEKVRAAVRSVEAKLYI